MAEQMKVEFAEENTGNGVDEPQNTLANTSRLPPGMEERKWRPGQSGNPGGRPRKKPITDAYLQLLESIDPKDNKLKRTIAQRIAQAMADQVIKKGSVAAAVELADRVEGKVAQKQEHTGADGGPMVFESLGSRQEVEVKIAMLLQQAQERKTESVRQASPVTAPVPVLQPSAGPKTPTIIDGIDMDW